MKKVKILILEDNKLDAELIKEVLTEHKFDFTSILTETKKGFINAIHDFKPEIILSDYNLPQFTGFDALEIAKKIVPDIPFIIVTGSLSEETAADSIKRGAWDYILKNNLLRLVPAIENAFKLKKEKDKNKKAEEEIRKLSKVVETTPEAVVITDMQGNIEYVNPGLLTLGSFEDDSLIIGKPVFKFSNEEGVKQLQEEIIPIILSKGKWSGEVPVKRKNGSIFPTEMTCSLILDDEGKPKYLLSNFRDITNRKKAEAKLCESEEKFRAITESAIDSIFVKDIDLKYIHVNPAMEKLFDLPASNLIGKTDLEFFGEEEGKHVIEIDKKVIKGDVIIDEHNKTIRGELHSFHAIKVPLKNSKGKITGLCGIARDITERKRAEQIQKVLYHISNAVTTTDTLEGLISQIQNELGTIIDTSNFYVALYEPATDTLSLPYHADEKDVFASIPAGNTLTKYIITTQKTLLADKKKLKELEQRGVIKTYGSDAEIWLGVPLKVDGNIKGVLVVQSYTNPDAFTDSDKTMLEFVSDQISISIERKKKEQDLIDALEKATESDRLKSAFLATMSHELRTPLNAIIGFSGLINEDWPIEEIHDFAHNINSSGNHLLNIIDDLFDITLIESGKTKIHKKEIDLISIMNDIHKIIKVEQYELEKGNIGLNLIIPPENKDLTLIADSSKFKQILINLLKNALKFTYNGHIDYGFSIEDIHGKPMIKFYVSDTGIGISKDKQKLIFNLFRQIDDSYTRKHGGTGIGLSISKKLTELLGGSIWLESEEGKGSTFYFTIPNERPDVSDKLYEPEISSLSKAETKNKVGHEEKTLLIVEDDENSFEFLKIVLEKPGNNILWAKNGKESIEYCRSTPDIALVLMDINMQVMNGYEATKEIKNFRPKLPIIAQTAYALEGDRQKALAAGCDDYISKPINKDELMGIISKYIIEA